jgi:hypothetical protein
MNERRHTRVSFPTLRRRGSFGLGMLVMALALGVLWPLVMSVPSTALQALMPWHALSGAAPAGSPRQAMTAGQRAAAASALAQQATGLTQLAHSRALRQALHEAQLDAAAGWTLHAGVDLDRIADLAGLAHVAGRSLGVLLLCDSSGHVLGGRLMSGRASAGTAGTSLPASVADWPVFAVARLGPALSEVKLTLDASSVHSHKLQFEIGVPVRDPQGQTRGVLIASLDERAWTGATAITPTADELACAQGRCPAAAALAVQPRALAVWLQEAPEAKPRLWQASAAAPPVAAPTTAEPHPWPWSGVPVVAAVVTACLWIWGSWYRSRVSARVVVPVSDPGLEAQPMTAQSLTPEPHHPLALVPGQARHTLATALQLEVEQRRLQVMQPGSPFCLAIQLAPGSVNVRLPDDIEHGAFWFACEALNNALRSGHHSDLMVHLHAYNHGLRLEVHDSGIGLLGKSTSCQVKPGWPRDLDQHVSLQAMRDRCATMGARLTVRCEADSGTRIILRWLP